MVRIARVKFSSHSRMYDYLCDNEEIDEGDVVNVEGKDEPYFVYEIAEVEDDKCKATKKVLGFAKENPNVVVASKYMDITMSQSDCIVNSLGPDTHIFGAICNSIVERAGSKEIEKMLSDHPHAEIFDMFITDAGRLPSKHVIHIVMPFKKDDYHNQNLKLAFTKVVNLAIENGFESIDIPYIGTGANGYDKSDIADALNDTMFRFQYKSGIKIKITSVMYNASRYQRLNSLGEMDNYRRQYDHWDGRSEEWTNDRAMNEKATSSAIHKFDIRKSALRQMGILDQVIAEKYKFSDEVDMKSIATPVGFVRKCKKKHKKDYYACCLGNVFGSYTEENMDAFYSNPANAKRKHNKFDDTLDNIRSGNRQMNKIELFRIAIFLRLNFTEFIQLMNVFGFTFSPFSDLNMDYEVFNYAQMHDGFIGEDVDIRDYFYNECRFGKIYDVLYEMDNSFMKLSKN